MKEDQNQVSLWLHTEFEASLGLQETRYNASFLKE